MCTSYWVENLKSRFSKFEFSSISKYMLHLLEFQLSSAKLTHFGAYICIFLVRACITSVATNIKKSMYSSLELHILMIYF